MTRSHGRARLPPVITMLKRTGRDLLVVALLTLAAVLIHGYHLGAEDQAIYLPAVKMDLDPGLYPHDAAFFLAQTGPVLFDELIALSVRITRLPLDVALILWHIVSVFAMLLASLRISQRCFEDRVAQWAGVALIAVLLTLPVAGTRLTIFAEYVHPRNLAMPALLFALAATLDRRATALLWLFVCALIHVPTAVVGAGHLLFQAWQAPALQELSSVQLLLISPEQEAAREVLRTRAYHYPLKWKWYELLGAVAPPLILAWFARLGRRNGLPMLAHVSGRLAISCSLGVAAGFLFNAVPAFEPLVRTQPMRALHLPYVLLFLLGGGLLGQHVLRNRLRWLLLFLPLAAAMCVAQLRIYPASPHIEWPGAPARNAWVQAFDWIRQNTPRDALFALDPRHMERPGEDFHGFRALAERSMMADWVKDRSVAALFPQLAYTWREQMRDLDKWPEFRREDFLRLRAKYGVTWVVLEQPGGPALPCPFANERVRVCRVE